MDAGKCRHPGQKHDDDYRYGGPSTLYARGNRCSFIMYIGHQPLRGTKTNK
jgi:hypothetical protein